MNTHEGRKFAVITGASSGIGYEFAKVCAEENFQVLVVADRGVDEAADRLRAGGAAVTALQADLSTFDGNEGVAAAIQQSSRPVDVLALNAGTGVAGPFLDTALQRDLALIQLNIGSVVHLSKRLLPAMVARGEGRVMITSSIAATMPGPYYASTRLRRPTCCPSPRRSGTSSRTPGSPSPRCFPDQPTPSSSTEPACRTRQ